MAVELDNKNLKVIKLENGEILFSKVQVTDTSKTNGYLELHWPMKVLMKFDEDAKVTQLALLKWLPFTDTTHVPLATRSIMSVSELGKDYTEFYLNSVKEATDDSTRYEMDKLSKILAEFDSNGLIN